MLCKCWGFGAKNIDQKCTSYKFDRKLGFFLWRTVYILLIQKSKKNVYVTVLLFILYSIGVHVERPKYKMICLKSPKSSEFAKTN